MGWGARLGATWRGKVSGADLGALFAATAGLTTLQQALADRRLDAKIAQADQPDHAGQEWRIILTVGPLAAPLWLAETLVGLAQAFYDEETQGQPNQRDPNRPPLVSPFTHDLIAALLAPVEDIIADLTTALADPNHQSGLTAPLHVGPGADIAGYEAPRPPSAAYARGLAKAARRVHTSAAALLMETQATLAKSSSAPDWLTAGLQRLNGSLQGAGARLDMLETRMEPLTLAGRDSAARGADPAALTAICGDLWTIADTALVAGQQISDPHLLPESPLVVAPHAAAPSPRPSARATTPQTPIRSSGPQAPARPAQMYRPIAPGIPPSPLQPTRPQPPQPPSERALPQIDEGAPSATSQAGAAPSPLHQAGSAPAPYLFAGPPVGVAFPTVGAEPSAEPTRAPAPPSSILPALQPITPPTVAPLPTVAAHPPTVSPPLPTVAPSTRPPTSALPAVGDTSRPAPMETRAPAASETAKPLQPPTPQRPPATPTNKADDESSSLFPEIG